LAFAGAFDEHEAAAVLIVQGQRIGLGAAELYEQDQIAVVQHIPSL
jgi:hypothetical protein